jgi:hypothetical protein
MTPIERKSAVPTPSSLGRLADWLPPEQPNWNYFRNLSNPGIDRVSFAASVRYIDN